MACLLTAYYRPKPGGLCTRLVRGINALTAAGHQVHYVGVLPLPVTHPQCHFHRFPWPAGCTDNLLFWGVFHLFAPWLLLYLGLRHRVTHAFAFGTNYALLLQPLRVIKGIPLTLLLRADILRHHKHKHRAAWLLAVEKLIESMAIGGVRLYAVSQALVGRTVARHKRVRPEMTGVLRNDIPSASAAPRATGRMRTPLHAACVAGLVEEKNHALVFNALAQLNGRGVMFHIYGDGPLRGKLQSLGADLGIADKVIFHGWVAMDAALWAGIDVLLFPSLHEGSPNAVLEALAYRVPVLASDIPELREILPPESLLPLGEPSSWAARLQALLDGGAEALSALAEAQAEYARPLRFDWDARFVELVTAAG